MRLAWRARLFPQAEQDEEFRDEVRASSLRGLRAIGGLEAALPAFLLIAGRSPAGVPLGSVSDSVPAFIAILGGLLTFIFSAAAWARPCGRLLVAASILWNAACVYWPAMLSAGRAPWIEQYLLGYFTLVLLGAVAPVPFKPLHVLALGLALAALHLTALLAIPVWTHGWVSHLGWTQHLITPGMALFAALLAAVAYRQRLARFRSRQRAARTAEEFQKAQYRLLISENAATTGRLAAGLAHELNSPVGVITSAVDTLLELSRRRAGASPAEQRRLDEILEEARRSVRESASRLREIVARMQRFTNLDRSEVQPTSLRELLSDVVLMLEPQTRGRVEWQVDLRPMRELMCRPQQLSAVFSNLLANAVEAVDGTGVVRLSALQNGPRIEVKVEDSGRGIPPEELERVFDPGFRVSGGRVATGNWNLFSARQILREHGGDIEISSRPDRGTAVRVTLPC